MQKQGTETTENSERATFGAGCFWGVEEVFRKLPGVLGTAVGYMGGHHMNPSYEDVCGGDTGHAEVVEITFDPTIVSYETLLKTFWENHDPTALNYQGPDVGAQYRSVIFFHSPNQESVARVSKECERKLSKYHRPIVTAIEPAGTFYRAEEYHQKYLMKRGQNVCH